jgi:hypothetical protein
MRGFHRPTEKVATQFLLQMLAGGRPPRDLSGALALCALTAVHMFTPSQAANARPPRGMDRFKSPMPLEFELPKEKVMHSMPANSPAQNVPSTFNVAGLIFSLS